MLPGSDQFTGTVRGFVNEYIRGFIVGVGPHYLSCAVANFAANVSSNQGFR